MNYHPPPLQPLWSFASAATLPHVSSDAPSPPPGRAVVGWSVDAAGRPAMRWAVGARDKAVGPA